MARQTITGRIFKSKIKRKGVHAKSKTSRNKSSKNYVKPYNRQGR